ncbi:hypothetical protein O3P69_019219 [Scylla paramamosain]|uniref:Condensation domain-containing protein n=1 Tax=Scylla paramamosain TaxID=85552 RepID=A0AAW0SVW8_SCYPA
MSLVDEGLRLKGVLKRSPLGSLAWGAAPPVQHPWENEVVPVAPGEWVRPLGNMEAMMAYGGSLGTLNTVVAMWLTSKQHVPQDTVREAVVLLARRTGILQLCVGQRALRPWFRKVSQEHVPFAVETGDPLQTYSRALHDPYDMAEGPLWRVKLVIGDQVMKGSCVGDSGDGGDGSAWRGVLIVCVHHCITDGVTNLSLCQDLIDIMNSTVSVYPLPRPPLATLRPVTPALADDLLAPTDYLKALPYLVTKLMGRLILTYNKKLYLGGVLQQPRTSHARTHVLQRHLTATLTSKLVKLCREKGVTVHSCVVAAANIALLRVAQKHAEPGRLHTAAFNTTNCVNLRRYYPEGHSDAAGCHIGLEEHEQTVREEDGRSEETFWGFSKVLHSRLQRSLGPEQRPVKNGPLLRPCCLILWANHRLTRRAQPNRTDAHFMTTNMGDLRDLLPGVGRAGGPIEAVHLLRSVRLSRRAVTRRGEQGADSAGGGRRDKQEIRLRKQKSTRFYPRLTENSPDSTLDCLKKRRFLDITPDRQNSLDGILDCTPKNEYSLDITPDWQRSP